MATHTESKACNTCAKSKRKCGRQVPCCSRCAEKGISCAYPPSRRKLASSARLLLPNTSKGLAPTIQDALHASVIKTEWFLAPETWRICHDVDNPAEVAVLHKGILKKYVAEVQSWFERWVTTGSNPFIHPLLYSVNFPACVQIAYSTLTSYIHRTPENTETILQAVEDRSHDLVQQNEEVDEENLFAQIARLHALMVYQTIGLFDGDIRSRYVAESHINVQSNWASKLYQSAAKTLSYTYAAEGLPNPSTSLQQQWYLWVQSESIRRTWLVSGAISSIFLTLLHRTPTCPGSVMYTNRTGLWGAESATEWEKQCLDRDAAFMQRFESVKLFDDMEPADVDEFGTAMLSMTVHRDLLEKWKSGSNRRSNNSRIQNLI
ncbi:hypothetical protein DM02DRAFT_596084 [Periconia macrospinosa]|uniref:Zn(2)-C6 fungal-type domain-containing protein n=1 Tax=Periconia macrospinosa TaxID=97972 RepID=A0A2V1DJJ9_9PLEO|nr:hypothetical protein DM02DRAFT_596084 [Periconia macrospinosa]